jgi:adenylate cyclase
MEKEHIAKDFFMGDMVGTALFLDIHNSLGISASLRPRGTYEFIKSVMLPMIKCVEDQKGFISQIQGDAIMALFGHNAESCNDHAMLAVQCALEQQKIMQELNAEISAKFKTSFSVKIGICSGEMYATLMDVFNKIGYTAMGLSVNIASRLEGLNKKYKTNILIDESTYAYIHKKILTRQVDDVRVDGYKMSVRIFEVLCKYGEHSPEMLQRKYRYEKGLEYYQQRDWSSAIRCFQQVGEDKASYIMIKRCRKQQKSCSNKERISEKMS